MMPKYDPSEILDAEERQEAWRWAAIPDWYPRDRELAAADRIEQRHLRRREVEALEDLALTLRRLASAMGAES